MKPYLGNDPDSNNLMKIASECRPLVRTGYPAVSNASGTIRSAVRNSDLFGPTDLVWRARGSPMTSVSHRNCLSTHFSKRR